MSDLREPLLFGSRRKKHLRIRLWVMLVSPLAAILFQVYVPLYVGLLSYLELPLLVTVYLAMTRRSQVAGILIGASIGLVQDALSNYPLGLLGMIKTLVGFAAASLGVRLDSGHPLVRFGLGFLFFLSHQALLWSLRRMLLGEAASMEILMTALAALVNGLTAILLFHVLDKLGESD